MKTIYKVLAVALFAASSLTYASENVVLKLDMFINNNLVKPVVLKGHMNEKFTAQINDEVKYDIVPSMENGSIKLSTIYYTYSDGEFIEKEKPVLVTAMDQAATIEIGTEADKVYKIQITPQTQI